MGGIICPHHEFQPPLMSDDAFLDRVLGHASHLLRGLARNDIPGLFVIQDGTYLYVNPRFAEMFGYTQAEVCDGTVGPRTLVAPEDWARVQAGIAERLSGRVLTGHYDFVGLKKDGTRFEVELFGTTTEIDGKPAIIGLLVDISVRFRAERKLQDQLRFVEQLIDTIPGPLSYKDEQGRYLGCNKAFEAMVGKSRDEFLGHTVHSITYRKVAEKMHTADQRLINNPGIEIYESQIPHIDGTTRDMMLYKATFNKADGSVGGLVTLMLDISERKLMEQRIWEEANYDSLTGLPNRRMFRNRLDEEIKRSRRSGLSCALLLVDLDRFKEVNDTLGHEMGDHLLVEAAKRITACVRESDSVARLGGDEFMVILPEITDPAGIGQVATHIIDALVKPFQLRGHAAYVSASVGVALFPEDAGDIDTLVSYADQAMYAAKEQGRSCFSYFTPALQERSRFRLEVANELRGALAANQLEVYYQPIIDLASGQVIKAEALLRWTHPTMGMVPPDRFIPIAEEVGLIHTIGDWVFQQAASAARRWQVEFGRDIQISVNKSPRQLVTGRTQETWIDYLRDIGLAPGLVCIEITEGLLMDSRPEVASKLLLFRDAGIQVSLDDFGTGYSAMSYLKKFDIDFLKIDKSFVRDLTTDTTDRAIAEAIIAMAHKLGLQVIAEGVETQEQRALLSDAGCNFAQGYLFARPMPLAAFEDFLCAADVQ